MVAYLLKLRICDINQAASSGNPPLLAAVNLGDLTMVRMLIAAGADCRAINGECGATALDLVCAPRSVKCAN